MNSLTLKENGFTDFVPLKELPFSTLLLNKGCVLVLIDNTLADKPESDILYIGKSKKPAKRIFGGYLAGYGGKNTRKINAMLIDNGYLQKISISWIQTDDPKGIQQELLEKFKKEHGNYPTWNITKKTSRKPQSTLKAATTHPTRRKTSK
jgi:hypothetical protein